MSRTSSLLLLLTGVAAGTALGILIAPASGATTRKRLQRKGDRWRKDLRKLMKERMQQMDDAKKPRTAAAQ